MKNDALPEEWTVLRGWLPTDLDERARRHGFIQRARGLTDAEQWLRLILMHVAGGLSLEQAAVRAGELGLAQVSGVALFKRLRKAEPWLRDICQYLLAEQQCRMKAQSWPGRYKVRVIDATDVQEPGDTGSAWRLHYSIQLPALLCDHYELTDCSGGEKLGRFTFSPDELVLADRGYCHRAGAAQVLDSGAALLLRWNPAAFPLQPKGGRLLNLLTLLRSVPALEAKEWPIEFCHAGKVYRLRLCAIRKNRMSAERARKKALRKAQRNGRTPQPESLEATAYIMILCSLPQSFPTKEVLDFYRCRWQVELAFKRLKTLLDAGHVPKSDDRSARAWMQAKLLTALLLERLLLEAKVFSPWGYDLHSSKPLVPGTRSA
jgi:hypothetical protein